MKTPTIYFYLLLIIICFSNCQNAEKSDSKSADTPIPKVEKVEKVNINYPNFSKAQSPQEIKNLVLNTLKEIDENSSKFTSESKKMTIDGVPNTPVEIIFLDKEPIKVSYGVTNDAGNFDGTYSYYLKNRKVWYGDQIYAKYVFTNDKLTHWFNENWKVNVVSVQNRKDREKQILEMIETLLL